MAVLSLAGVFLLALAVIVPARSADPPEFAAYVPGIVASGVAPTPTPTPVPTGSPVTMTLASGGVTMRPPIEARDTILVGGTEFFDVPSHPSLVAWYQRFGRLGSGGSNTLFAGHINYVGYGAGPFAYLTRTRIGDDLVVETSSGKSLRYTVQSVAVVRVSRINMDEVVYPALAPNKERVTLISCGGTFVPNPSGVGGQYDSRVIVYAERYVE